MKGIALVFAVLLVLPVVIGLDTEINVKTLPEHKVSIFVLDPAQVYSVLESYHIQSDSNGFVSTTYSGDKTLLKINVEISKGDENVMFERFEDGFDAGKPVYLQVIPGNVLRDYTTIEVNDTEGLNETVEEVPVEPEVQTTDAVVESEENLEETNPGESTVVTGSAISGVESKIFSNMTYFIIAGVVLVVAVLLIILKMGSGLMRKDSAYKYKSIVPGFHGDRISDAERELEKARKEIQILKKREGNIRKIAEMEMKVERDREELERLRKEDRELG